MMGGDTPTGGGWVAGTGVAPMEGICLQVVGERQERKRAADAHLHEVGG